jgi:modification methylase
VAEQLRLAVLAAYSQPSDLVLGPMCGIGTTLVEAIHLGTAIGIELEARWAALAEANTAYARSHGATGTATVITGDARQLPNFVDPHLAGQVALVLTSFPYGRSLHGQVTARPYRHRGQLVDLPGQLRAPTRKTAWTWRVPTRSRAFVTRIWVLGV